MDNSLLNDAKKRRRDEFYTLYEHISDELERILSDCPDVFKGKTVLCPCDDPDCSQFSAYFRDNFVRFGLKRLISTSYAEGGSQTTLSDFTGGRRDLPHGKIETVTSSGNNLVIQRGELIGDGDFRSKEITLYRDMCDYVITNPPFSLFKEFFKWSFGHGKGVALIGHMYAVAYKDIFPAVMKGDLWWGHTLHGGACSFKVPDDYESFASRFSVDDNGNKVIGLTGVRWYVSIGKRYNPGHIHLETAEYNLSNHRSLRSTFIKRYGCEDYPRYYNVDALECPLSDCIPSDYDGLVGVPISFLDRWDPTQFSLEGITATWFENEKSGIRKCHHPIIRSGDKDIGLYVRLLIRLVR